MPADDSSAFDRAIGLARRAPRGLERRVRERAGVPPRCPRGWTVGPPDFVGVGAQRAGTTWWFRLLTAHPDVSAPYGKERHFFDPYSIRPFDDNAIARYHASFPRPPGKRTGEWTPRYMYDHWVPGLLRAAAPEARLLVLLRDPWARFLSGLKHESGALERQLRGSRGGYVRAMIIHDALGRSLYATQLERLLEGFDRSQVLVLQYERCVADPHAELRRTYAFIGVDPNYEPSLPAPARARSPAVVLPPQHAAAARDAIRADAERLARNVSDVDLRLWPGVG